MANRRARLRAFKCRQGLHRLFVPYGSGRVLLCADCPHSEWHPDTDEFVRQSIDKRRREISALTYEL